MAWLLMMTRTRAVDRLRHEQRRPADGVDPSVFEHFTNPSRGVEAVAATEQEARRARDVLARMPSDQREAVELAYFEGLTHSEIAERMSQPLGTVKSRIRTALQELRMALKGAAKPTRDFTGPAPARR